MTARGWDGIPPRVTLRSVPDGSPETTTIDAADAFRDGHPPPPMYLDRAQVRQFMGLGDTEVERAFRALPVYRLSMRRVRVRRDELIAWIEGHRLEGPRGPRGGA
jgi:hypothetical protein